MNKILAKAQLSPLKCNKRLSKKFRLMTFDCETKDGLKGSELFCASFCYKERNAVFTETFYNLNDIYAYCKTLESKAQKTITHNIY